MRKLNTYVTRRRLVAGLAVVLLLATTASACNGDGDSDTIGTTDGATTTTQAETPTSLPDLVISGVSVQPAGQLVSPGQVQISATVRNVGAANYGQAIVVQAPGNHTGTITGGLDAGASGVAVIDFPAVSANTTYTFTLVVDPDNVIAEESESNNESTTITISTSF
jgi:subtilase family serine protease